MIAFNSQPSLITLIEFQNGESVAAEVDAGLAGVDAVRFETMGLLVVHC